jgi:hypothetical protein
VKVFVTVLVATKNLHSVFEAVCEGVTVVKVFPGINGNRPAYPCSVCGAINWWRQDGVWGCGRYHPDVQGEELFRLDDRHSG